MELSELEGLALGVDRAEALAKLPPGAAEHDYWRGVLLQHENRLGEVDAILEGWRTKHGGHDSLYTQLARRQLIAKAAVDLPANAEAILRETGTRLDDRAEVVVQAQRFPTTLDPSVIERRNVLRDACRRKANVEDVSDAAIADIVRDRTLIPGFDTVRRAVLQRLRRSDIPGLVDLLDQDLADKNGSNRKFGGLPLHAFLTLAQLEELAQRVPDLTTQSAWVHEILKRLEPAGWVDLVNDQAERAAFLERVYAFARTLAPTFNSLKAAVLYHRLELERASGVYDRARFRAYLELPRSAPWVSPDRVRRVPPEQLVQLNLLFPGGITAIGNDEPLVREYLARFLLEEDVDAYADLLDRDWLARVMATTRLLAGATDPAITKLLSAGERDALRDRVDIELAPQNPRSFAADADVALEVDVKNVKTLEVKVFRIDALAYWLAKKTEVDTSIDLDGMVPSGPPLTLSFDHAPIRRHRVRIDLPACKRAGTYVVELIGNGRSSRALFRKGALRHLERTTAAGTIVTVTDDDGNPVPDARLWLGDRELSPKDGSITVPFATDSQTPNALLVHGDVVQRVNVKRPFENAVSLNAGFELERESLVANTTARLLCHPKLLVGGAPVSLALLEEPKLDLTIANIDGTTTTRTQAVALRDDADLVFDFNIPDGAIVLEASLRGRYRVFTQQQTVDVASNVTASINGMNASEATAMLHLARVGERFVISLLGKTGEALAGRAVALLLSHRDINTGLQVTLETDPNGEIDLGAIDGTLTRVMAALPAKSPVQRSWMIDHPFVRPPAIHAREGEAIVLPRQGDVRSMDDLWLREFRRNGAIVADANKNITLTERTIRIEGLAPGEYNFAFPGATCNVTVVPRATMHTAPPFAAAESWTRAGTTLYELPAPVPIPDRFRVEGDALVLHVANASAETRVHVLATRYVSDAVLEMTTNASWRQPLYQTRSLGHAQYLSGRDIGDEARYVLERRNAPRRPGMMLEKPSLLLHPWELRTTTTSRQEPSPPAQYSARAMAPPMAAAPARAGGAPPKMAKRAMNERGGPVEETGFPCLDFLPKGAVVIANVRPDATGAIRIPLADLGADAQNVQAFVVDPELAGPIVLELSLPAKPLHARDLRLRLALEPDTHFAEQRRVEAAPADTTLVVPDVRTGKIELVDTLARAHSILVTLMSDASDLNEFAFVTQWHTLADPQRRENYSKYACHELNLFLWRKDPAFFAAVIKPSLADKREKALVDRFLLGEDLAAYSEPWAFGRLNAVERVLLAMAIPALHAGVARLFGDEVDLIPPDPERDARLVTTLLGAAALEVGQASAGFGAAAAAAAPAMEMDMMMKDESTLAGGVGSGGDRARRMVADVRSRERAEIMFRGAEKTKEWAEVQWWKRRVHEIDAALIAPNRFWSDLAAHAGPAPFLSPYLGDCANSFAEAMCALAFLELPFVAAPATTTLEDTRLTIVPKSHALAASASLIAIEARPPSSVLIGQSYLRSDDRWEWSGNERREKRVTGELIAGVVYRCQVVVTNPTSANEKLDVLMQIPRGAMPVDRGFITRTVTVHLSPYGTQSIEYAFYFPLPGRYTHFPAHVTRASELLASAPARELDVLKAPSTVDHASWSHVSQHGTLAEVLAFLEGANLGRTDLGRIAWRMHDKDAFTQITAALAARHVFVDKLWAYALRHHDTLRAGEWVRHQEEYLVQGGIAALGVDPIARGWYQHLEYAPLINARAHQLGAQRRILNDGLDDQYKKFLDLIAHRRAVSSDDLLVAAHYQLAMDRVEDAIALLARVRPEGIDARAQFAYLSAYVACFRGDLPAARALATPGLGHPVERWRKRFVALVQMLDEIAGVSTTAVVVDQDSRDQRIAEAVAKHPTLGLEVRGNEIKLTHANLAGCQVRFFAMDVELLFSRQPFVQGDIERFSFIEPGMVVDVAFGTGFETTIPIPPALASANLVIEAVAPGLRESVAHYAHDLGVQVAHAFGQVKVVRASTGVPLPAVYVKVYSRERSGRVVFYKDGYTDLRGRLDYATLSTDDLDRVERFALLVVSDDAGATITEAAPPTR